MMTLEEQSQQMDTLLEFNAPLTSASNSFPERKSRPFSIDLSLELERQLEMDSQPSTPAHDKVAHEEPPKGEFLDPHVLAHIIKDMRQEMARTNKEREDLLQLVAKSTAKEAELNDALQHMTDKATELEEGYADAKRKLKDDEEAISMLRTKVEESRRGLMRLQSENRRQSAGPMALDLSRAGSVFGSPTSSKRASFTPMTGTLTARANSHRRISSHSEFTMEDSTGQTLLMPDLSSKASRRTSGFFSRSPQQETVRDPIQDELDAARKELNALKDELEETRAELQEATEAKDASETCVKALRDFIAEHNVGTSSVTNSPVLGPTDPGARKPFAGPGGWGFKLWKVDTSAKPVADQASATTPAATTVSQMSPTVVPLGRKIGGFFGSRASISSISTDASPQLQSNAAGASHRASILSNSDTSSLVEPLSPTSEEADHVVVRTYSDAGSMGSSPPLDNIKGVHVVSS